MVFAFITARKPASVNRKNKNRGKESKGSFIEGLRQEVQQAHQNLPLLDGELYARIIWFHQDRPGDPDNIIKPILDALQTVVYDDDSRIVKVASERFNLLAQAILLSATATPPIFDQLIDLIAEQHEHILYIEIDALPSRDLHFGPVR